MLKWMPMATWSGIRSCMCILRCAMKGPGIIVGAKRNGRVGKVVNHLWELTGWISYYLS